MRNLKRALSVALASVMLLGMMVVGTSAAGFPDVKSTDNVEAIEVMKAIGAMIGDDKGNFNPDKAVTRNEMAVVMCNLMGLEAADYAGTCIFTDVPAWAQDYVAACYANKIVSGASATTYNGNATVTTAEASLMMQKALGYFQFSSDFGDDWKVATIKQASKISLLKDISGNADTALTRNNVAKLGLNALKATMVEAVGSDGVKVEAGGATITTGSTVKYEKVTKADSTNIDAKEMVDGVTTVQLGEDLFEKLKLETAHTDFGAPAHKWTLKGQTDPIVTVADEADDSIIAKKDYDTALAAYQDLVDDNFKTAIGTVKVNGSDDVKIKAGDIIDYYDESGDDDVVDHAYVTRYALGKITKVSTTLTKADKEDGVAAKLTIKNIADSTTIIVKDTEFAGYNANDYVKNAYILYVNDSTEVIASQLAESIEGKVTALKGDDARIDGSYYKNLASVAVGDSGTFYLNVAGQIMGADTTAEKSSNYALVYTVDVDTKLNSDGISSKVVTAYLVLADGTKANYVVDADQYVIDSSKAFIDVNGNGTKDTEDTQELEKSVIAYSINSDKELELKTSKDIIAKKTLSVSKTGAAGTDSSTQFVFAYTDSNKLKTKVVTGYKNVSISSETVWTVTTDNSDKDILYVFVAANNGSVTSDADLAVLVDADAIVEENADGDTVYTYSVSIDGKDTELTFKTEALKSVVAGTVFEYSMDGDYAKYTAYDTYKDEAVFTATKDYIILENQGTQYNLTGDETYYTVTVELKDGEASSYATAVAAAKDADNIESVSVSAGGEVDTGDMIVYTLDSNDMDVIYVYDFVY